MMKFTIQHDTDRPDRACVVIDDRFLVATIRTKEGLRIEVYPITDGEPWMAPCDRFEVDEEQIRELEQQAAHD